MLCTILQANFNKIKNGHDTQNHIRTKHGTGMDAFKKENLIQ
jgi:hypothetical protein